MSTSVEIIILFLVVLGYLVAPVMLIWGWVRWVKRAKQRTISTILSLSGFILATCSALLAISSAVYAVGINGFPFYDPRLLRIFRWGMLLSAAGLLLSIGGVWRKSSLRWHSPASALGMLAFWFLAAVGE